MKYSVSLALATLLLGIVPIGTCLGAAPASPGPGSTGPAESKPAALPDDPFGRMVEAKVQQLKTNMLFEGMEFETFVVKPFVVLMTREPSADPVKTSGRKARIESLARGIWQNWLKVRDDWQLASTRKDTLENPEPFVWAAFHSEDAYNQYMKKAKDDGKTLCYPNAERKLQITPDDWIFLMSRCS